MTFTGTDFTGAQSVLHWARATPQATAAMEGGSTHAYGQFAEHIARFGQALRRHGVRPGMLVVLECRSRYVHLTMTLALEALGAVVASCWAAELPAGSRVLEHGEIFLLESPEIAVPPGRVRVQVDQAWIDGVLALPLPADWQDFLATPAVPAAPVRLNRTSGTTGQPKFMLYKRSLIGGVLDAAPEMLNNRQGLFHFIGLHHFNFLGTYIFSMLALRFGHVACFSTMETFLADVNRFPFSLATLLVGEAARFADAAASLPTHLHPCSVGVVGGAMSAALEQALLRKIAVVVRNAYHSNEALAIAKMDSAGVGTLLEGAEVRIVDEASGRDLPQGAAGIILVRSARVIEGYLWDDELTRRHFADGWYRSNDIGFIPAPGKLVVMGRADDMLNIGGVKVAPLPIEENIKALPGVTEAVLLAFENQLGAGELHVVVERRDPAADADLHTRIPPLMTGYFGVYRVHYVTSLPRTNTGKVQRNLVRQQLLNPPAS